MSLMCVLFRPYDYFQLSIFQTELAINTHVTVSEIHHEVVNTRAIVSEIEHNVTSAQMLVSDIHRTIVKVQEGSGGSNLLVSDAHTLDVTECPLTVA